jgi:hypothetical protein
MRPIVAHDRRASRYPWAGLPVAERRPRVVLRTLNSLECCVTRFGDRLHLRPLSCSRDTLTKFTSQATFRAQFLATRQKSGWTRRKVWPQPDYRDSSWAMPGTNVPDCTDQRLLMQRRQSRLKRVEATVGPAHGVPSQCNSSSICRRQQRAISDAVPELRRSRRSVSASRFTNLKFLSKRTCA